MNITSVFKTKLKINEKDVLALIDMCKNNTSDKK